LKPGNSHDEAGFLRAQFHERIRLRVNVDAIESGRCWRKVRSRAGTPPVGSAQFPRDGFDRVQQADGFLAVRSLM
jgi:hypothetical protein